MKKHQFQMINIGYDGNDTRIKICEWKNASTPIQHLSKLNIVHKGHNIPLWIPSVQTFELSFNLQIKINRKYAYGDRRLSKCTINHELYMTLWLT